MKLFNIIIFTCFLFFNNIIADDKILKIAVPNDLVPYSFIDKNGKNIGLIVDYWKLWSKKTGIKVEFVSSTWNNTLLALKNETVDIHSGLFKNKKREEYIDFIDKIYASYSYLYVRDLKKISTIEDLSFKTVGVVNGSYYDDYLSTNYKEINIKRYDKYEDVINAIKIDNIDSFFNEALSTWYHMINTLQFLQFKKINNFKLEKWFYAGVKKGDLSLSKIVKEGMSLININDMISLEKKWVLDKELRYLSNLKKYTPLSTSERTYLQKHSIIELAVLDTWNKFSFLDKNKKLVGFHLDLLKQININLDTNITYKVYDTWNKAYLDAKNSKVDGILGLSWSKSRDKFFNYSPVYYYTPNYIITRKDDNSIKNIEDVDNKVVVSLKNSIVNTIIKEKASNAKLLFVEIPNDRLLQIKNKKADMALLEDAYISDLKKYDLKIANTIYAKSGEFAIGTSKNNKVLSSILTKGINSLTKKQLDFLTKKWFENQENITIFTKEELRYINNSSEKIVGIENWEPIIYQKNSNLEGVAGDIFKKVLEKSGLKVKFVTASWHNLLKMFKNHEIDILPATVDTKDRETYGLFTDEYLKIKHFIYIKQSNKEIKGFKDLFAKKLAIVKDFAVIEEIKELYPSINIIETKDLEDSITMLQNNEVDALFEGKLTIENKIRELLVTDLKAISQNNIEASRLRIFSIKEDKLLNSILQKSLMNLSIHEKNSIISKWLNPMKIKKRVNVSYIVGREPYVLENEFLRGIEFDLLEKILDKSKISISNIVKSKNKSVSILRKNLNIDIVLGIKREKNEFFYSNDFISFQNVVISRVEDNLHINKISDLKDKRIFAFKDAWKHLGAEYKKLFRPNNKHDYYTEVQYQDKQVQDFLDKKSDVIILDKNMFFWYLRKLSNKSIDNFKFDYIFSGKNNLQVAFRDENMRNIFNEKLALIKQNGEYEEIFFNYFKSDIYAKIKINSLISSIISTNVFTNNLKELENQISVFIELPFIEKIEVYKNNYDSPIFSSSSKIFKKSYVHDLYYVYLGIPQKVGYLKVYFNEKELIDFSKKQQLIPHISSFKKLKNFYEIQRVYKSFNYLDKNIIFTKKEKNFIKNHPNISYSTLNWEPIFIIEDGKIEGILSDYIKIIEEKTGLNFVYQKSTTWKDMKKKFKNKEIDLIPKVENFDELHVNSLISKEILNFRFAIVTNKDGIFADKIDDLSEKIIALPTGFPNYNSIKEKYPNLKIKEAKDMKEALSLVSKGEAYAFVAFSEVSIFNIKKYFPNLKIAGITEDKFIQDFLIQKDYPELLSIINKVLSTLTYKQRQDIRDKWIQEKINVAVDYTLIYEIILVFTIILLVILLVMKKLSRAKMNIENTNNELENSNKELQVTIENLKQTQEQLIASEKMASLGGLVAGVAHEINTPVGIGLTGISHLEDSTKEIAKKYKDEIMSQEEFEEYLKTSEELSKLIHVNLNKAASLVKSFKQVAVDQSSEEKREFNLKKYMNEILLSINSVTKKTNIKIEVNCEKDIKINSYPGAYSQVITNLIMNSIIHGFKHKEIGEIKINIEKKENKIEMIYKDNGKGIKKENINKIFDPFFTTNRENGGSGLGLNIIYNIITTSLSGTISCKSEENDGVEFIIILNIERGLR